MIAGLLSLPPYLLCLEGLTIRQAFLAAKQPLIVVGGRGEEKIVFTVKVLTHSDVSQQL